MLIKKARPEILAEDVGWQEKCTCGHLSEEHYWDSLNRKYKNCSWCDCEKFASEDQPCH